ncbi:patatin-like phospholipase family protein [Nocardia sp. NBC_01503]|uniref:patatin-like phospholipase family protein n=1 Tax=Nocardia sp. NBC_01503 TaxID=2975997 RepID=UPI002E7B5517|nr:patatin-like phospholipase family protein [Nocardia sp. NBC_01503]WTL29429.1 patatin-like phospholipase family protein [Nocardia sp. NBC_01503]
METLESEEQSVVQRALVIGGGGVAGIAWATGVIAGMADAGVDVTDADLIVGTSAGANVAAQLSSGLPLAELFRRQVDSALQSHELKPQGTPIEEVWERVVAIHAEAEGDPMGARRKLGALALEVRTVPESARRAVIESRLPIHEWPQRRLLVTAVDALTGELRIFDRDSGVPLVDAVTASSAVPLVWPPHTIDGVRYTDGGVRSSANADLAAGCERVLVLAPLPDDALEKEVAGLAAAGARVAVISPDDASLEAFGTDPLDAATRVPAANAGRAQGKSEAARVAELWG